MTIKIVRVSPVEGRLVLMPDRAFQPVPAEGARVYLDAFYTRAINQGDLKAEPDVVPTPVPAAPAFVSQTK